MAFRTVNFVGSRNRGLGRSYHIARLIFDLNIDDLKEKLPEELSGGQRAVKLVQKPPYARLLAEVVLPTRLYSTVIPVVTIVGGLPRFKT